MLENLTIKARLYGGFAFIMSIIVFGTLAGILGMNMTEESFNNRINTVMAKSAHAQMSAVAMESAIIAYKNYILRGDEKEKAVFDAELAKTENHIAEYKKLADNPEEMAMAAEAEKELALAKNMWGEMAQKYSASKGDIKLVDSTSHIRTKEKRALFEKMTEEANARSAEAGKSYKSNARKGWVGMIALSLIGFGLAIAAAIYSVKSIIEPIRRVAEAASRVAEGNLNHEIAVHSNDELGALCVKFNEMVCNLRQTMVKINSAAGMVSSSSLELSATSDEMAKGASAQDAQASQVAAAVEQMSATVLEVARHSAQAAESSKEASESAKNGGSVVEKTIVRIQRIARTTQETAELINTLGSNSNRIGEIVSVINDIADQTNLLALNAAIEAARAGEQGRGFAVVADEVRKLAERTTKATKEIAGMIKTIQSDTGRAVAAMDEGGREVADGVELATQAGQALGEIVSQVDKVTEMIQMIAAASEEMSTTSEQISCNVENIASVIKQNADAARNSSAAAQTLTDLSGNLRNDVAMFNVDYAGQGSGEGSNIRKFERKPGGRQKAA
ncbi:MAG TPA: methyl-accepting chemotaxis protein [Nitrospirota bacterium]